MALRAQLFGDRTPRVEHRVSGQPGRLHRDAAQAARRGHGPQRHLHLFGHVACRVHSPARTIEDRVSHDRPVSLMSATVSDGLTDQEYPQVGFPHANETRLLAWPTSTRDPAAVLLGSPAMTRTELENQTPAATRLRTSWGLAAAGA